MFGTAERWDKGSPAKDSEGWTQPIAGAACVSLIRHKRCRPRIVPPGGKPVAGTGSGQSDVATIAPDASEAVML